MMTSPTRFLRGAFLSVILLMCGSLARAMTPLSETQTLQTSTETVSVSTVSVSTGVSDVPLTDWDRAQEFLQEGKNQDAADLFERMLAAHPNTPGAWEGLAQAQLLMGDISKAETSAGKILERDKQDPVGWVLLARAAFARGRYGKTLSYCKKALKYEPHYSPAYFWRGKAYDAQGEVDEAKNEYHAATLCNQKQ